MKMETLRKRLLFIGKPLHVHHKNMETLRKRLFFAMTNSHSPFGGYITLSKGEGETPGLPG